MKLYNPENYAYGSVSLQFSWTVQDIALETLANGYSIRLILQKVDEACIL